MLVCEGQVGGIGRDRMALKRMLHNKEKKEMKRALLLKGVAGRKGSSSSQLRRRWRVGSVGGGKNRGRGGDMC